MLLSIVIPLFDCRTAGLAALESALAQRRGDGRIEVVAVAGLATDAAAESLLARCDSAVRLAIDTEDPHNEIALFAAGARAARGDLLFFVEGHTVLERDAAARVLDYFGRNPDAVLAWSGRHNHGVTPLGRLVGRHNLTHEARAGARGAFTLGANSVIRHALFERLGGFDPRLLRYSEFMLFERAVAAGVAIGRLPTPLCTHHNDMPVTHWTTLIRTTGEARCRYYRARRAASHGEAIAIRHPVYAHADHMAVALVLEPVARIGGAALVRSAIVLLGFAPNLAYRIFVLAVGLTDLSGYCAASVREARARRETPVPA